MPNPRAIASASAPSPVLARRRLGAELRGTRIAAGLSGAQAARRLGWSQSKVSRYEKARTGLKAADVAVMLDLYKASGQKRDALMSLAAQADARAWWEAEELPQSYQDVISAESSAELIRAWAPALVPDLAQSPGYARARVAAWSRVDPAPRARIDSLADVIAARQEILETTPGTALRIVLDESALHRTVGGPDVMREQMRHLLALAGAGISIRILPWAADHAVTANDFALYRLPGHPALDIASTGIAGHQFHLIDDARDAYLHEIAFDQITEAALGEDDSAAAIAAACQGRGPRPAPVANG